MMDNHVETASRIYLSAAQSRCVDQFAIETLGMNSLVLMENAGREAAERIKKIMHQLPLDNTAWKYPVTLLIGPGNNGGDGWVIARHLETWGIECATFLLGSIERLSADNRANFNIWLRSGSNYTHIESAATSHSLISLQQQLENCDLIVDALLGTGTSGSPREPMATAIQWANRSMACRVAIDLPTGLDADLGDVQQPTFRAHHTLTMVTKKLGFKNPKAQEYLGEIHVLPIGIPASQLRDLASKYNQQKGTEDH